MHLSVLRKHIISFESQPPNQRKGRQERPVLTCPQFSYQLECYWQFYNPNSAIFMF
jgi:hypothetical protein